MVWIKLICQKDAIPDCILVDVPYTTIIISVKQIMADLQTIIFKSQNW